jgi:polysaccharide export outer membrane protein
VTLAVAWLALPGCARKAVVPVVVAEPAAVVGVPAPAVEPPYTLDSGDRLRIVVFGQEGLSNAYAVDASGNVTMPLIGAVVARGLTSAALSRSIADKLRQGYIREPHVAVEIEAYRPFFILGEVALPGQYPYVPHMTAENAVAIAGGFTGRAQRRFVKLNRTVSGEPAQAKVPLTFPVRPGDTVVVAERWF